jgi:hypothetical protein
MGKKLVKCCIWNIVLDGGEIWTLQKMDQKNFGSFEMWCWRRMEKISWTDHVRNAVLHRVREEGNILRTTKQKNANWITHVLHRNCLLKHGTEEKVEDTGS